ncbi:MAG: hypothetical protein A3G25_12120 [Betaproteobacteria bacterium RIFCSPLOWO2_12_FULL_63_13]|nr:MAG: hypothetical protein A3H32_00440 [Betaproteobacteria bacterium RIFCSPLOWO2_02_FULL_63_19]OGA44336.1 MAG: hypothetical protein A3G25_12120 [Betaproteobacteria bacterium RIFCSPLOWO2_12_FULL_63_13]
MRARRQPRDPRPLQYEMFRHRGSYSNNLFFANGSNDRGAAAGAASRHRPRLTADRADPGGTYNRSGCMERPPVSCRLEQLSAAQ